MHGLEPPVLILTHAPAPTALRGLVRRVAVSLARWSVCPVLRAWALASGQLGEA